MVGANGDKWNLHTQIREAVSHRGHIMVRGRPVKRGEPKTADDVLSYKPNLPLAVIEAKAYTHAVGGRMQQALECAENPDAPNAHHSNGHAFPQHDRTATDAAVTRKIPLDQFPSPAERWARYCAAQGLALQQQVIITQDHLKPATRHPPRHDQQIAINRTINTIARMEFDRLLTMATGTGKTYTAFQIIRRLWKFSARKRIPFLVDRNILADQTKTNDFKLFGTAMTKINNRTAHKPSESSLRAQRSNPVTPLGFQTRNLRASKVAGLLRRRALLHDEFLRLWTRYQAVIGTEEEQNIYKQVPPGFFDLAIIDECHRGSAADDAAWKGRYPRADPNGNAPIRPRGCDTRVNRFRRHARDTVRPDVPPASRWHPHDDVCEGYCVGWEQKTTMEICPRLA